MNRKRSQDAMLPSKSFILEDRFSVNQMYGMLKGGQHSWGIKNYNCVKIYQDPNKQIQDRSYLKQKKGTLLSQAKSPKSHPLNAAPFWIPSSAWTARNTPLRSIIIWSKNGPTPSRPTPRSLPLRRSLLMWIR